MYQLIREAKIDSNNKAFLEYSYIDSETGKFVKTLTPKDLKALNKLYQQILIDNFDNIWDRMATGASLGEVI